MSVPIVKMATYITLGLYNFSASNNLSIYNFFIFCASLNSVFQIISSLLNGKCDGISFLLHTIKIQKEVQKQSQLIWLVININISQISLFTVHKVYKICLKVLFDK